MSLQIPYRVLFILLAIWAGGCANRTLANQPMRVTGQQDQQPVRETVRSFSGSVGGFDRSLTEAEKSAIISDLKRAPAHARRPSIRGYMLEKTKAGEFLDRGVNTKVAVFGFSNNKGECEDIANELHGQTATHMHEPADEYDCIKID